MCVKTAFLLSYIAITGAQQSCRTPNGDAGKCMLLDDCEPLANINSYSVKTPDDILFLRQSNCGLFMNSKPKVCCPPRNQWADYSTIKPSPIPTFVEDRTSKAPTTQPPFIELYIKPVPEKPESTQPAVTNRTPFIDVLNKPLPDRFIPEEETCKPSIKPPAAESFCCGMEVANEDRIIGGTVAGIDQYPWLALLVYNGTDSKTACGGALISARYVLSAAHCLERTAWGWPVKVRLAEFNTSTYPTDVVETDGGGFEQITVVEIRVASQLRHPGYVPNARPIVHDIGLIKLTRNAPYTEFIRPICLPTKDISDTPNPDFDLVAAGWGSDGVKFSEVKLHIKLPFVPLKDCQTAFGRGHTPTRILDTQICAGGEKDRDTCGGDSGGPLMYMAEDTFTIVGIVSFGAFFCGTEGKPGVYTNVYKYLDWINDNMV